MMNESNRVSAKIHNFMHNRASAMNKSRTGSAVIYCLWKIGLMDNARRCFAYIKARRLHRNPTKAMLDSREFFLANADRMEKAISWLSDEASKMTLRKMIDFRCSYDVSDFPIEYAQDTRSLYILLSIFEYTNTEVFVDCGAYNGDTIGMFKSPMSKKGWHRIVAFEPDHRLCELLRMRHKDVAVINAGCWSGDAVLSFSGDKMMSVGTGEENDGCQFPVRAIDSCMECGDATFIKMDIEGAEMDALMGAEQTILRMKPKLAICIYHSDEDMLRIIEWIHGKVPEYRLFVRQHSKYGASETVLYATL